MLFKLAALGALGYAGYKYYEKNQGSSRMRRRSEPAVALAGGPLSSEARVQHTPDAPNG
jgi:uncharacterized membrane protein YebE (DUF533 family)